MSLFTAARLIALPKKSGGIRPIAVGDTLRRLTAKCLLGVVNPSASTFLLPLQVGVQVPNAAERVARHVSLWARTRAEDEIILQVDMRNVFNSIDMQEMLNEVKSRTPLLYPYAAACYQSPSVPFGEGFEVNSPQEVQQVDVCGPLLFSVTLHRLVLLLSSWVYHFSTGTWMMG